MVKSLLNTLRREFSYVDVWLDQIPDDSSRMTYIISASDRATTSQDRLISQGGFNRAWYRINQPLTKTGTPMDQLPVFTDDYVPVERMISGLLTTRKGL